jgi:uncharacterized membrane protein (UPF0127 family)
MFIRITILFLSVAVGITTSSAAGSPPTPAASGREQTTPQFEQMGESFVYLLNDEGKTLPLRVKIADEPHEQAAGFQHVGAKLITSSFILFTYAHAAARRFHMLNVPAALDIAFIASDGTILEIQSMEVESMGRAVPSRTYGPQLPFRYALEARAGFFGEHGISPARSRLLFSPPSSQ